MIFWFDLILGDFVHSCRSGRLTLLVLLWPRRRQLRKSGEAIFVKRRGGGYAKITQKAHRRAPSGVGFAKRAA
jgi:hypothetical protein